MGATVIARSMEQIMTTATTDFMPILLPLYVAYRLEKRYQPFFYFYWWIEVVFLERVTERKIDGIERRKVL